MTALSPVSEFEPERRDMNGSDTVLRDRINGPDGKPAPEPRKRQRFGEAERVRMRLINAGGVLAAVAGIAMALSFGFLGKDEEATPEVAETTAETEEPAAPKITTLDNQALVSDGGQVNRSEPLGLGGRRVVPSSDGQPTRSVAEPQRPEVKIAPVATDAATQDAVASGFSTLTTAEDGAKLDQLSSAILVARSNLVWAKVFTQSGLSYAALKRASLSEWGSGACAQRQQPVDASYCTLDGILYAPELIPDTPVAKLALINQIGEHVQENLGVTFRPAAGEARSLRSDCFAGLWAQLDAKAAEALAPGVLRNAMAREAPLTIFERTRLDAYTIGYTGSEPQDCEPVGQPG